MDAWLVASSPARGLPALRSAVALARRIDAILARPQPMPRSAGERFQGVADPDLSASAGPIPGLIARLEAEVDALANRTRRMVEHAEAAAGGVPGRPVTGTPSTPASAAGREDLELVWGDSEG